MVLSKPLFGPGDERQFQTLKTYANVSAIAYQSTPGDVYYERNDPATPYAEKVTLDIELLGLE